jgi:MtrB/PioB family decaheme-associated outer membrane protein
MAQTIRLDLRLRGEMIGWQARIVLGVAILMGVLFALGFGTAFAAEAARTETSPAQSREDHPTQLEPLTMKTPQETLSSTIHGDIEVGGQTLSGNTSSPTLREYRDLDGKPTIPHLRLQTEDKLGSRYFELGGTDMTRTDAFYYLRAGAYNTLQFDFEFDRLPHTIAINPTTIYTEAGSGKFVLPPGPPTAASFNAVAGVPTQVQRDAVEAAVNGLLHGTELGFQTDTARAGLRYLPRPELELKANYSRIDKDGRVPFGTVIGTPGSGVVELAAPRKERNHELTAGAEYGGDWYQLRLNYAASLYENDVQRVEWDGVCGTGACGNTSALGRTATAPDNHAHTFSGAGGISLPWWRTRLTAATSVSLWRQNETFLPVTTLSSRNFSDAGATSPDAKMNVFLANVGVSTRPLRDVTAGARYRYYELDNETPVHQFTNVLNPGDLTPVPGAANASRQNVPIGFRKQNASTDIAWRIAPQITAKVGYEWEHWGRTLREARESNEQIAKGSVDVRPWQVLLGRFTFSHGVRTIGADGYIPLGGNATALPLLRKFDEADRTRDKGEFFVQASPVDPVTISGSFFAQQDIYFNSPFGLQNARAYGWSADISWSAGDRLSLFSGYAHDDYQSTLQSCFIPGGTATCDPANTFFTRPRDLLDTLHAGLTFVIVPQRVDLGLDYRYTFGRSKREQSSNPGGLPAGEPASVPEIKNVFHVANVVIRHYLTTQWTLKVGYSYERYRETDFTVDTVSPSLANVSAGGFTTPAAGDVRSVLIPIQHPAFEAHIVAFSVGYKF